MPLRSSEGKEGRRKAATSGQTVASLPSIRKAAMKNSRSQICGVKGNSFPNKFKRRLETNVFQQASKNALNRTGEAAAARIEQPKGVCISCTWVQLLLRRKSI